MTTEYTIYADGKKDDSEGLLGMMLGHPFTAPKGSVVYNDQSAVLKGSFCLHKPLQIPEGFTLSAHETKWLLKNMDWHKAFFLGPDVMFDLGDAEVQCVYKPVGGGETSKSPITILGTDRKELVGSNHMSTAIVEVQKEPIEIDE